MWGYDDSGMSDHEACAFLRRQNVAKAVVEFSGGGDEGGVNAIKYLDAEDNEVKLDHGQEHDLYAITTWDKWNSQHGKDEDGNTPDWPEGTKVVQERRDVGVVYRLATDKELEMQKVVNTLGAPVYARYGSFAGEFYVDGEVIWNVAAGTHRFAGQESQQVWNPIDG